MSFLARRLFLRLLAAFALFALTGDIVADSVADLRGDHCVSQSSESDSHHDKGPCSHCSCAVHNGSAVVFCDAINVADGSGGSPLGAGREQSTPVGVPSAIDHPPQLA